MCCFPSPSSIMIWVPWIFTIFMGFLWNFVEYLLVCRCVTSTKSPILRFLWGVTFAVCIRFCFSLFFGIFWAGDGILCIFLCWVTLFEVPFALAVWLGFRQSCNVGWYGSLTAFCWESFSPIFTFDGSCLNVFLKDLVNQPTLPRRHNSLGKMSLLHSARTAWQNTGQ